MFCHWENMGIVINTHKCCDGVMSYCYSLRDWEKLQISWKNRTFLVELVLKLLISFKTNYWQFWFINQVTLVSLSKY